MPPRAPIVLLEQQVKRQLPRTLPPWTLR